MDSRSILQIAAFAPLLLIATAAPGAVYRCAQPNGTVLYSDSPCAGGSVVDIHPGAADPNAKERLARAQAELDRAAAERRAQEQFEAARREAQAPPIAEPSPIPPDAYYGTAYDFYAPYAPADRLRDRNHRAPPFKVKDRVGRVPQVVRTPHPPR